jgi:uncharacterized protein with LGFP repeats
MSWRRFGAELSSSFNIGKLDKFRLKRPFGVSGRVTIVKPGIGGGARIKGSQGVVRASGWSVHTALGLRDTLFRVHIKSTVATAFASKYRSLHRAPGKAVGNAYALSTRSGSSPGKAQNFRHGRMIWNAALNKVVWQWGPILHRYDQMGMERSALGMPVSGVWGPESYQGASYSHGDILWSRTTGAQAVRGPFLRTYRRHAGPSGPLSLPLGPRESSQRLPHHGARQPFQGGALYLNPMRSRVYALWGRLERHYQRIGQATSQCGYPTSSMTPVGNGSAATFEHGTMRINGRGRLTVDCNS